MQRYDLFPLRSLIVRPIRVSISLANCQSVHPAIRPVRLSVYLSSPSVSLPVCPFSVFLLLCIPATNANGTKSRTLDISNFTIFNNSPLTSVDFTCSPEFSVSLVTSLLHLTAKLSTNSFHGFSPALFPRKFVGGDEGSGDGGREQWSMYPCV